MKTPISVQILELKENGNHYYNLILDFDIERCEQNNLNEEVECMKYINNYIKEINRLKLINGL